MKKKTVALLLALVLVFGVAAGGTLAWLTDKTTPVVNTFTYGDINIELTETWNTDSDNDNKNDCWTAYMAPGYSYAKDPKVTVKADSVDCYLFVKFEKSNDSLLTYTSNLMGNGWTQGTGEGGDGVPNNVWYRVVKSNDPVKSWELIANNTVSVASTVTKEQVMALGTKTATLTYTAFACQLKSDNNTNFTPAEAWAKVAP